ncbi:MAG: hypothetical protein IKC16_04865 [Clostridia bacterium]|nr:hypothetical protein [Clostridia bacterium]
MKKLLSIMLISLMLIALLASCGAPNNTDTDSQGDETNTDTESNVNTDDTETDSNSPVLPEPEPEPEPKPEPEPDIEEKEEHIYLQINESPTYVYFSTDVDHNFYKYDYYSLSNKAYKEYKENQKDFYVSLYFANIDFENISSEIEAHIVDRRTGNVSKIDIIKSVSNYILKDNTLQFKIILEETLQENEIVLFSFEVKRNGIEHKEIIQFPIEYTPITHKEYLVGRFEYIKNFEVLEINFVHDKDYPHIFVTWETGEKIENEFGEFPVIDGITIFLLDDSAIFEFETIKVGDTIEDVLEIDPEAVVYEKTEELPQETYHFFENCIFIFKYENGKICGIEKYIFD